MKPITPDTGNVLDPQGLAALKRAAKNGKPSEATLKQVAQQFEALFLQMTLKSMREAGFGDELFDSEQGNFYRDMHDQQLALTLAKSQGIGLTDVLVRQLGGSKAAGNKDVSSPLQAMLDNTRLRLRQQIAGASTSPDSQTFVQTLGPAVRQAANDLGVAPEALLSIAALETGWGSAVMQRPDGTSANNYFGIKAGSDWTGDRVTAITHEYIDGRPVVRAEQFRAYPSAADSVADFAQFLKANPRYRDALNQKDPRAFVEALAAGGYATDPAYAGKVGAVLGGDTLRRAMIALKNSGDAPIPA